MDNKSRVLELLDSKRNVLLLGAPGTGKSKLMNDIAEAFESTGTVIRHPRRVANANVPIPAITTPEGANYSFMHASNRKVFRTTLHQNSKYRDFLTGIVPTIGAEGYKVNEGILYRANEYAKQPDSAALIIIDELNRGPAIEVFGGSIVAIEPDKRLGTHGEYLSTTQSFEIENPENGELINYAFSQNLYILAAMNQADVSVAPLDVAFMRRWQHYSLTPDYNCLFEEYGIPVLDELPNQANSASDVYLVAFRALEKINEMISVGRGEEYQLGHGVFLSTRPITESRDDALKFVNEVWSVIFTHIKELFFGDSISIAYVVNAESDESPYYLDEVSFAGETKTILKSTEINETNIFSVYRAIAENE